MDMYTTDYVTRGGVAIEIELPLGWNGRILSREYLSDSERRKLIALQLQAQLGEDTAAQNQITIH